MGSVGVCLQALGKQAPPEERQRQREVEDVNGAEETRIETERREGSKRALSDCGIK